MFKRLFYHLPRISHQLGRPLRLGDRKYIVRGYYANRLDIRATQHEEALNDIIRDALKERPGAFIDIGANIGQTLLKVLKADPGRTYFGFEPQLACCHLIETFLKDNKLGDFHILPLALSDHDQLVQFYSDGAFDEMASLIAGVQGRDHRHVNFVQARKGDALFEELGVADPAVIKIDVEGAELQVIRGLRQTLQRAQPVLFFEVMPNFTGDDRQFFPQDICLRQRQAAQKLWTFLSELGYRVLCIDGAGQQTRIDHFELDDPDAFLGYDFMARPADA
jgi:FkbM family methyltransferase